VVDRGIGGLADALSLCVGMPLCIKKIPFIRFLSVSPLRRVQYGLVGHGERNSVIRKILGKEDPVT
jgi:hypothetical protein